MLLVVLLFIFICAVLFYKKNYPNNYILEYAKIGDPYINPFIIKNILNKEECLKLIEFSKIRLIDSEIIGGKFTTVRNSQQCWINKNNKLVKSLFEKMSKKFNIPFDNAEDLQVVKYLPNQFYKEHHDSCCDNNTYCNDFLKRGGQRILTILIYLNDNFENGYTFFKNLNLKLKPQIGDAIIFYPLSKNSNKCHPLALHEGLPVTKGEKWIANLWFRENYFH